MINPLTLLKRELRDILDFRRHMHEYQSASINKDDIEEIYQLANKRIKPIQIKAEIIALINYLNEFQPENYCEIGLANGGTCFLISNSVKSIKTVYGIDLHIFNKRMQKYFAKDSKALHFKTGSSTDKDVIGWLKNHLENQKLDVLFIDGDHSYQGVKKDFENYHGLVRDGGLVVFHDVVLDYAQKYGVKTNRDTGGVPKFYDEVSAFFPSNEFIENNDQNGFGIGVIHYSDKSFRNWLANSES